MKRAALYARVSTEEQARFGLSLPDQRAALLSWAHAHDLDPVRVYEDPGVSARKRYTTRPGLSRLLDDARAGLFDVVLFTKLDRWVRSVRDYYAVQDVLDAAGVTWQATQEDYETATASGRLKVNIMLSVAQDEADRTSERIRFVFDAKRARGERITSIAPLGLFVQDGFLKAGPDFPIAQGMFEQYVRLRSVNAARLWLSSQGYPRSYTAFRRLLSNEAYRSFLPPDLWELSQQLLRVRAQRCASSSPDRVYLFSGLLFCGECGRVLNCSHCIRRGIDYRYYRCTNNMLKNGCPRSKRIREDLVEQTLLKNLLSYARDYNLSVSKSAPKIKAPDPERIRRRMEKLKDLYLSDLIDRDTYARDYDALRAQLAELPPDSPAPVDLDRLSSSLELYDGLSTLGKKEFWGRILSRVDISLDNRFFVSFR